VEDGRFQIETFELVNIIIGGLFAVIALNFTVNTLYQVLGSGDNPVSRLFALNYSRLRSPFWSTSCCFASVSSNGISGATCKHYLFLIWAIPLLVCGMGSAVVLVAIA
jgi:hypothetical protein